MNNRGTFAERNKKNTRTPNALLSRHTQNGKHCTECSKLPKLQDLQVVKLRIQKKKKEGVKIFGKNFIQCIKNRHLLTKC